MTAILGRYEAWGRLSQGGMSEVWLARHAALAMPVVVKTLRPEVAAIVPDAEAMLVDTARLVARLSSAHVVRVLDAGAAALGGAAPVPCVVEEYVDGLDLAELDRDRRQALGRGLPLWAVAERVADAAAGLHAAHQGGVLHRDVKPANLFVDAQGGVKVGDFGIAVAAHSDGGTSPAGTPSFMAPEQRWGETCDRRTDVFSLGATAFALRYGQPPWADTGELRVGATPRFPPARTAEEAAFQHVVAHAMAHRADARPPTARHLEAALRRVARSVRPTFAPARLGPGRFAIGETQVRVELGDIAEVECDAVVNSAYHDMSMSSGTGAAIRARGGAIIEAQATRNGPRALGECVVTTAGALPCRAVMHAVGAWNEVSCIARATWRALLRAEESGWRSIALPAVGTGRGRVSMAACADTMASVLRHHLMLGGSRVSEVRFVLHDPAAHRTFEEVVTGLLLGEEPADEAPGYGDGDEGVEATIFASAPRLRRA